MDQDVFRRGGPMFDGKLEMSIEGEFSQAGRESIESKHCQTRRILRHFKKQPLFPSF